MSHRMRVLMAAAALLAVAAAGVEYARTGSPLESAEALVAGGLAAVAAVLALTLPGLSWRGVVIGGFFVTAGITSWTYMQTPIIVWTVLAIEGVVFAVWSYPWLRRLRELPVVAGLGTVWLGLAYWLFGIVGAVLVANFRVAAERTAYAGVFTLAVLAVVVSARRRRDLTVGVAAVFLFAIATLLFAGAGTVFDTVNAVPAGHWGTGMERRFWGGEWLLYHPNSLAGIAVLVAIRIGPDRAFAAWQRLTSIGLAAFLLYLTNSRTSFVFAGIAAILHAVLAWRRYGVRYPSARTAWLAVATPFVALALVFAVSGGAGFITTSRYTPGDVTSGRGETWHQALDEWFDAGSAEKIFGDTKTARAVVIRDGNKLTTDNTAVGALRRGGVLGFLALLLGLALLVWHATFGVRRGDGTPRRAPPAWFTIVTVAILPTMATTDWLLGGTGGTAWVLLLTAEAALLYSSTAGAYPAKAEDAVRDRKSEKLSA
jgi:hypothetical protein